MAGLVSGLIVFCFGFHYGYKSAIRLAKFSAGLKCDYFFSYPGERCRLTMGHEGRHIPPVAAGGLGGQLNSKVGN